MIRKSVVVTGLLPEGIDDTVAEYEAKGFELVSLVALSIETGTTYALVALHFRQVAE